MVRCSSAGTYSKRTMDRRMPTCMHPPCAPRKARADGGKPPPQPAASSPDQPSRPCKHTARNAPRQRPALHKEGAGGLPGGSSRSRCAPAAQAPGPSAGRTAIRFAGHGRLPRHAAYDPQKPDIRCCGRTSWRGRRPPPRLLRCGQRTAGATRQALPPAPVLWLHAGSVGPPCTRRAAWPPPSPPPDPTRPAPSSPLLPPPSPAFPRPPAQNTPTPTHPSCTQARERRHARRQAPSSSAGPSARGLLGTVRSDLGGCWQLLASSWLYLLLLAAPLGLASGALGWGPSTTFALVGHSSLASQPAAARRCGAPPPPPPPAAAWAPRPEVRSLRRRSPLWHECGRCC
jgi:hypothetical protein